MTRINIFVPPENLIDQHLLAELRELPRIPSAVKKRIKNRQNFNDVPKGFVLGSGHVKYFYDKLAFLAQRYMLLTIEYQKRFDKYYNVDHVKTCIGNIEYCMARNSDLGKNIDYDPQAVELITNRIKDRISTMLSYPRYYREDIDRGEAIKILYQTHGTKDQFRKQDN